MTTIILHEHILATDTRQTRIFLSKDDTKDPKNHWYVRVMKLRVSRLFAVTGAGDGDTHTFMRLLPFFLCLRVLGVVLMPFWSSKRNAMRETNNNLIVCWRSGHTWIINFSLHSIGPLCYAKCTSKYCLSPKKTATLTGGTGGSHLTLEEVKTQSLDTIFATVDKKDPYSNADYVAFNTKTWTYVRLPVHTKPLTTYNLWTEALMVAFNMIIPAQTDIIPRKNAP